MAQFQSRAPEGDAVAQLETLVRAAIFKSASQLVGWLLQQAAERIDACYQPKPGEVLKGRATLQVQGMFGRFDLTRAYYYHAGKKQGHYPADEALGLEVGYTPALAKLICLEGADEQTYLKAQRHLEQTGGIAVSARQIQRVVQRVGSAAQSWQEREAQPSPCDAPILYVSGDGTGVPMMPEELKGRKGKQADGTAKTRQVYLGCVFTQHRTDDKGHPVRDYESTTYVSSFKSIDDFGPLLRQEAIRRGMGSAGKVVLLVDGAAGLGNMGKDCFQDAVHIVDFYHGMEHAAIVMAALIGKNHPDYKKRLRRWAKRLLKDKVQNLIDETGNNNARDSPRKGKWKRRWVTSCATSTVCNMEPSGPRVTSSAPVWWKQAAKPSSAVVANNRACFGRRRALKTSWPCAASTAAGDLISSGNIGSISGRHATTHWRL
jgi:hypothetical protein